MGAVLGARSTWFEGGKDDMSGDDDWHVIPNNDGVQHDCAETCVCGPTCEPVPRADDSIGWLYIHHSLDGRELNEANR